MGVYSNKSKALDRHTRTSAEQQRTTGIILCKYTTARRTLGYRAYTMAPLPLPGVHGIVYLSPVNRLRASLTLTAATVSHALPCILPGQPRRAARHNLLTALSSSPSNHRNSNYFRNPLKKLLNFAQSSALSATKSRDLLSLRSRSTVGGEVGSWATS